MIVITPLAREELVAFVPKGGVAAEIGVWNGFFSRDIMRKNQPRLFHMVDPWGGKDDPYVVEYNIAADMEEKYQSVKKMFENEIASGAAHIHRDFCETWAQGMADGALNWIYVDGMHSYEAVRDDLAAVDRIVADDGLIIGHDFSNIKKKFGVIRAVKEFIALKGYSLIAMTIEDAPSYVIAKKPDSAYAQAFLDNLVKGEPRVIRVHPNLLDIYGQSVNSAENKKYRYTMQFGER